jgi:hypothetical protein
MLTHGRVTLLFFALEALIFGLVACGAPDPTATATPVRTMIDAKTVDEEYVINFDGTQCILSGPPTVPVGDYRIVLNNLTGERMGFAVGHIRDGHTYQDLLDMQGKPGAPMFSEPDWVSWPIVTQKSDATNERHVSTFSLEWEGEYFSVVGDTRHTSTWFCGSIVVAEGPSE